jgi:hypothetical protein
VTSASGRQFWFEGSQKVENLLSSGEIWDSFKTILLKDKEEAKRPLAELYSINVVF